MVRGRPSSRLGSKRLRICSRSYTTVRLVGRPRDKHEGQPLNIGPTGYSVPQRMQRSASSREDPNGGAIAGLVLEEDKLSRAPRQHLTATRAHDDRIFDVQCTETDLVVRRLDVQHHILLEHSLLPRSEEHTSE